MQGRYYEETPETRSVKLHEAPSQELLEKIAVFQDVEASWNSTVFDLSVDGTFAVVRDSNDLIGVASIHELSPHNYWLGNVVVAKRARRCGIGSKIVSVLLSYAETKGGRPYVVLIASKSGEGVYRRLGFEKVDNIKVSLYERPALPPPGRSTSRPSIPNEREHEDAVKLDQESHGVHRGPLLKALFEKDHRCAILKSDSSVVSSAWARYYAPSTKTKERELHIGPVVAKSPDFAVSVVAELLRIDHAASPGARDNSAPALVLAVQRGNSEASKLAFEALGFTEMAELPYMRKVLVPRADCPPLHLDLLTANEDYYAMTWWDIA